MKFEELLKTVGSEPHPFLLANRFKRASYVSLQSALSFYGMIPENVPVITSVTTGRPEVVDTPVGAFIFRHIKKSLFNGYYSMEIINKQSVFIAKPEKSLLDLIYLVPGAHSIEYLHELRLQNLEQLDLTFLRDMALKSGSRKLRTAFANIQKIIETEEYVDL